MHFVDAKGILSAQNGMNLYRGCTHGCIYCDSRSRCYRMNHAFEDVEVKINAPELLESELKRRKKRCMIGTGSMSDPYMHCEEDLGLTRSCLKIILKHGFGLCIQTKSARILRDLDLLTAINKRAKCVVQMTLTTFDEELCRLIEPNVSTTQERYEVLKKMQEAGIPTVVYLSPVLPFINDTEENLRGILDFCFDAESVGILCFGFGTTMREGSREPFYAALDTHFAGLKQRYIRSFGSAYECTSPNNETLLRIFQSECRARNVMCEVGEIFDYLRKFPSDAAYGLPLFDI
ncbi:MAG: radical SAM protein [Clostridia bacterium]|nr:radical SAM protein [Clostridia bacterium]